ncbi:MAG: PHP domain-containing protein [Anaerolineales bacterium]
MLTVEFHAHTCYSKDSLLSPGDFVAACARKGIDRVVVTDHNAIEGALACRQLDPDRVIVGEEIMTAGGELLGMFLRARIAPGLSPRETIDQLRAQGAFISVAHPFDRWRKGAWQPSELVEIAPYVDAIEIFNSRCMTGADNQAARDFAGQHGLAGTVGSDAHTAWELGRSVMLMPEFADAGQLCSALQVGVAHTRLSPSWIHLLSRYARLRKRLGLHLDMPRGA